MGKVLAKFRKLMLQLRWIIGTSVLFPLVCVGIMLSLPIGLLEWFLDVVGEWCDSLDDWRLGYRSPYRRWFSDNPWW